MKECNLSKPNRLYLTNLCKELGDVELIENQKGGTPFIVYNRKPLC